MIYSSLLIYLLSSFRRHYAAASFLDTIKDKINLTDVIPQYNFVKTEVDTKWQLRTYARIAESSLKGLRKQPPHETIKNIVKMARGDKAVTMETVKSSVMSYSKPYMAMAGTSCAVAFLLMAFGIFYCCATCLKRCFAIPTYGDEHKLESKTRFIHIICVCVVLILVLVAGIACLLASRRINAGVTVAEKLTNNTFHNLVEFQSKSLKAIEDLMVTQLDEIADDLVKNLLEIAKEGKNVFDKIKSNVSPLVSKLEDIDDSLGNTTRKVSEALEVLRGAQEIYRKEFRKFETQVGELQANLTGAKNHCSRNSSANIKNVCENEILPLNVSLTYNSSSIKNATSDILFTFAALAAGNLTGEALNINASTTKMIDEATNATSLSAQDMTKFVDKIKTKRDEIFKSIEDVLKHTVNKEILSKNDEIMAMFNNDAFLIRASKILSAVLISIASIIIVMAGILFTSYMFGLPVLVHGNAMKFQEGSKLPCVATQTLLIFLRNFFLFGPILLVILSICIVVCGFLTQVCLGWKDGSILSELESSDVLGGSNAPLQKLIPQIHKSVTIAGIIETCGNETKDTLWYAGKLDQTLDLKKLLKLDKMADPLEFLNMKSIFDPSKYPMPGRLLLKDAEANFTSQIGAINQTANIIEPLLNKNWTQFNANMTKLFGAVSGSDVVLAAFFGGFGDAVKDIADGAKDAANDAADKAKDIADKAKDVVNKVKDFAKDAGSFDNFLNKIKEKFLNATKKGVKVLEEFVDHFERQVGENIGKCGFINTAYNNGINVYCYYFVDGANSVWLSLGLAVYTIIAFMASFITTVYYFRLAELAVSVAGPYENSVIEYDSIFSEGSCQPEKVIENGITGNQL